MRMPDDEKKHNVVRLGTETLFAIADQLRRMYDADLRTKPSEEPSTSCSASSGVRTS